VSEESPLAGRWIANLAKSERDPNHQFQGLTMEFAVAGNTVTIAHHGINHSGHEEGRVTTLQADGKEHPLAEAPGVAVITRWLGPRTLETVARKGEESAGRGVYEVSADGQSMTAMMSGVDGSGREFQQVIVFDRGQGHQAPH
jgi:hypothetical protein